MLAHQRARGLTAAMCISGAAVLVSVISATGASAQTALPVNYDFGSAVLSTFSAPAVSGPGRRWT